MTIDAVLYIKHLMKSCKGLKGGLIEVAQELGVESQLSSKLVEGVFERIKHGYFMDNLEHEKYAGRVYGLGEE